MYPEPTWVWRQESCLCSWFKRGRGVHLWGFGDIGKSEFYAGIRSRRSKKVRIDMRELAKNVFVS